MPTPTEAPGAALQPAPRPALWLALLCAIGVAHLTLYAAPFEDSYISFRYARHVASGLGYVFNPGERVEGFTSFAWVTMLAGFSFLGVGLPPVGAALSAAGALVMLLLTARIARGGSRRWLLAPALVAAHGTWAYYGMSGMETTLFCALLVAALGACLGTEPRVPLAGLLLAAATLTRPEGAGYLALTAAVLAAGRRTRRCALGLVACWAAVVLPYFVWRWRYFGYPLPNTYYAKAAGGSGLVQFGWQYLEQFLTLHAFWLVPIALVWLARREGFDLRLRLCAAWLVGGAVNVLLVGGDAFAFYRFLLPIVPVGALVMAWTLEAIAQRWRVRGGPTLVALALVALTFGAGFLPRVTLLGNEGPSNWRQVSGVERIIREHVSIGRWMRARLPPGTSLAINAAGIIPYESDLPTIDMLGLNDVHIAHLPLRVGRGARGHEKHDAAYVLARQPDLIVPGLPLLSSRPIGAPDLHRWFGRWTDVLPGDGELLRHPELRRSYRGVSVTVTPGRYLTMFVRESSYARLFPGP